ncbi:hypothetical protein BST45_08385 [Mycobacterium shinjukuense]|nr:hypothetical protein BST45_08385 [Mycobacterium shinjukuense]
MAGRARPTVAAVANQDPASPTGLPRPRRAVGAVADQRAPKQHVGGRIDQAQDVLLQDLQG